MTGVPLDVRIALLRAHGSFPQAFSATVQDGFAHFGDERGFIGYKTVWGTTMVLADPIAPREHAADLIDRFLAVHKDVAFCQVSKPIAELLIDRGFFINEMGPENRIPLPNYDFKGAEKDNLRRATNRMKKGGFVTREGSIAEIGLDRILAISNQWRNGRVVRTREVAFINRPLPLEDEPDVRKFFTFDKTGKLVAYAFFDPVYEAGAVTGYMSQHHRHLPEADAMAQFAIKRFAIETFQKDGLQHLYLGLSPFAYIEDKEFRARRNRMVRRSFRFAFKSGLINRWFYPLQSLCEHKRRYHAEKEQTYFAINRTPGIPRVLKLMRACNIV
jgi:phosphatidylglycerol lysyltransferase